MLHVGPGESGAEPCLLQAMSDHPDFAQWLLATPDSQSKPMIPKQLHGLLPRFRSSDFDYILFDMPRLCATSPTVPMASFMDLNLVVIDSETTTKEQVKQGIDEMIGANAKLSCVLNKSRHVDPFMLPA